ncbi:ATP-binding protein [Aquiflexum sp. LQ15W]|uniref:ATP-binding protein n=1 Tax=Cognataquiflexum nitidum TaxID=2922272 RepID=UPI001F12E552|nr:ATP-binding protein [Cognataquiflexum nitidum]MCH6200288.1 ATP-binding protein [Cognataquiflexum nitidum]
MVRRKLESQILEMTHNGKILLISGPRQVGKTTLLRQLVDQRNEKTLWLNCDNPDDRSDLTEATVTSLTNLIGSNTLVIVDEAQRVKNIGLTLKLIVDNIPNTQVIASGSSALELANEINEPLTGRKREFHLYPFSTQEMAEYSSEREEKRLLEARMIYGFYPEVVKNPNDARDILEEITSSYLYKDILTLDQVRKPVILQKLLLALALQVGSEITFNELGNTIGIDKETAEKYLDLLEKSFVVFRLNSFNRNMRREIKKGKKVYFWDNGIRNAIVNNFNSLSLRNDVGGLWENFIISERMKFLHYNKIRSNVFFWRTTTGKEIDWIEERDGKIYAFEAKWNPKRSSFLPQGFEEAYPESTFQIVNSENYMSVLV